MFDAFVNMYCIAVSLSNLMCNSNLQILLPGPMLLYITKYLTKSNVLDDTMTFEKTLQMMINRLLEKRKPTDFGEGLSRIICASFIHNSKNVIGPALARYLTVHHTRFRSSHDFCYIPMDDIYKLLTNQGIKVVVLNHVKRTYLENCAYHYVYRPKELEKVDPYTFCEKFEIKSYSKELEEEQTVYRFVDGHPNIDLKCVIERLGSTAIPKMRIYDVPNSSNFHGTGCIRKTQNTKHMSQI